MTGLLLDSYAWIEFFIASKQKGETVKQILSKQICYTSAISIAEISEWCEKNRLDSRKHIDTVIRKSVILNLNEKMLEMAGRINFARKREVKNWGLVDSIILTSAKIHCLNVVTGDKHFKDVEGTIII